MDKSRIILTDDHNIFRAGLRSLIDKEPTLQVVAEAADGEQLLERLKTVKCDLVVVDLSMPNMDGMSAIKAIRRKHPKIKLLVLTMQKDAEHFKHAMASGATGYILKDDAYEQLVMAIKLTLKGKNFISPAMTSLVTERYVRSMDDTETPSLEILTKRERQILEYVANGMANKNIAGKLRISIRTVETHRANLCHKLGMKNASQLVKYAIAKGLV